MVWAVTKYVKKGVLEGSGFTTESLVEPPKHRPRGRGGDPKLHDMRRYRRNWRSLTQRNLNCLQLAEGVLGEADYTCLVEDSVWAAKPVQDPGNPVAPRGPTFHPCLHSPRHCLSLKVLLVKATGTSTWTHSLKPSFSLA